MWHRHADSHTASQKDYIDSLLSAHLCVYVLMVSLCVSESVCLSCPTAFLSGLSVCLSLSVCLQMSVVLTGCLSTPVWKSVLFTFLYGCLPLFLCYYPLTTYEALCLVIEKSPHNQQKLHLASLTCLVHAVVFKSKPYQSPHKYKTRITTLITYIQMQQHILNMHIK